MHIYIDVHPLKHLYTYTHIDMDMCIHIRGCLCFFCSCVFVCVHASSYVQLYNHVHITHS